jgi:hypothetical protein
MKRYLVRIPSEVEAFTRHLHPRLKRLIRHALKALEEDPYRIKAREILIEVIDIAERKFVYQRVASLLRGFH